MSERGGEGYTLATTRHVVASTGEVWTAGAVPGPAELEWVSVSGNQNISVLELWAVPGSLPDRVGLVAAALPEGEELYVSRFDAIVSPAATGITRPLVSRPTLVALRKRVRWGPWWLRVWVRELEGANLTISVVVSMRLLDEASIPVGLQVRELAHHQALMSARGGNPERAELTYARHLSP